MAQWFFKKKKPKPKPTRRPRKRKTTQRDKGFKAWVRRLFDRMKRFGLHLFILVSVVTATFPSVAEGASDWLESVFPKVVSVEKAQAILAIPLLGDILKRANLPWGAIPGMQDDNEYVDNPFS